MKGPDGHVAGQPPEATIRLAPCIHLRAEADGGALLVDDRTLTAAYINKSAHVLFRALCRPRVPGELVRILAATLNCPIGQASAPVAKLLEDAARLGWLEASDAAGTTS